MSQRWSTKGGRSFPARNGSPPPMEFFEPERPAAGTARFGLSLDDLRIEVSGLDPDLAAVHAHAASGSD